MPASSRLGGWAGTAVVLACASGAMGGLSALALAAEPWKSAVEPHPFTFPRDHAAHEDYRIEWWYYTGNLETADGRRFGYQLTFFRTGLVQSPQNPSRWAVRDLYLAHFALTDLHAKRFHFFERVNRRGIGWAGAETDRYRVWNGDWQVRLDGDRHLLNAKDGDCQIELKLSPQKPAVLHGERGLSPKGPTRGNASHYYSFTRIETSGTVTVGGVSYPVTGSSWMDHEFSSSFLEKGQKGWDWFAVQLDDGRELMIYQIRRSDGTADPFSSGTLIDADGRSEPIRQSQFSLTPKKRWKSAASGAEYAVEWTLRVPDRQLELHVEAALADQEMNTVASTGFPYWEGSIAVRGTSAGKPVQGRGYLEMTGYTERALGDTFR